MSRIAERFEQLLDIYRKPDGGEWGGQDLEDATKGTVTRSYVSMLRRGKIESAGFEKLEAMAEAMGFPPALWFERLPSSAEYLGIPTNGDPAPVPERLENLFETVMDEEGEPLTNAQVARMSFGGLTEGEVAKIRSGEIDHPTFDQVLAVAKAFGVGVSYFTQRQMEQDGSLASLAQEEAAAIVRKTMALSQEDRKAILDLLDHLGRRGASK